MDNVARWKAILITFVICLMGIYVQRREPENAYQVSIFDIVVMITGSCIIAALLR